MKNKVYKYLRNNFLKDWVKPLQDIVYSINCTKNKGLNYEASPSEVNSIEYDPYVQLLRRHHQLTHVEIPQKVDKKEFNKEDNVYLDFPSSALQKSTDVMRGQIYVIDSFEKNKHPYLYKIKDLLGEVITGTYMAVNLIKAPDPLTITYPIEKFVSERKTRRGKEVLVKWLHYPPKFNQWMLKKDVISNE